MVDEGSEFLGLCAEKIGGVVMLGFFGDSDDFFVDPHLDLGLKELRVGERILSDDLGNGGAPSHKNG